MMSKSGRVYFQDELAGIITETENGYIFEYDDDYFIDDSQPAISLTLPKNKQKYESQILFSFFDGLIPEGWLLDIAKNTWKIDSRDRMALLLHCCKDTIGAVSVIPLGEDDE
jgi:serine/threonine-protein kinase HipA